MNKADKFIKDTIIQILDYGSWDKDPRPRWSDGKPAHSKFITQQYCKYDISRGEFPITTLRPTALKGAFYDVEAIYIKQTDIIEEMHPSIQSWWQDFIVTTRYRDLEKPLNTYTDSDLDWKDLSSMRKESTLGQTYGAIVNKYALVDKLLKGLEENPFGRRHIIDMWQYHDQNRSPKALVPCAFQTLWSVREEVMNTTRADASIIRFIDLTLTQRSMDFMMTASINPAQYVMLGMMVCNHLTYKTGIKHTLGNFSHFIQNCHIYDRHIDSAIEILGREELDKQPTMELVCEPKDFYKHTIDDFKFNISAGIKKLSEKLELAV